MTLNQPQYDYAYGKICFHQAGHAVMALAFNYLVTDVAARPEPRVLAQAPVDFRSVADPAHLKARYQADVLISLAPLVGAAIHRDIRGAAPDREPKPHATDEAVQAGRLLGAFGQDSKECLKEYLSYAAYILKQDPYLAIVKQIAARLYRKGRLVADEIDFFHSRTPKLNIFDIAEVIDELLPARYSTLYPELLVPGEIT